jgi:hypothetical protein
MRLAIILCGLLMLAGCGYATKGGRAGFATSPGFVGVIEQPENPKDATTGEYVEVRPDGTKITWTTKIGAAQKNTLAETAAKLRSLRPVMFVGIVLFIFGAASLVYPPLKLIVGSSTTSALAIIAGLGLVILPTLIVGNEILILCAGVGAVALYWFSHRHGELRGALREKE